jgi:hypothetical protein
MLRSRGSSARESAVTEILRFERKPMVVIFLLSADSAFTAVILRFFGLQRRDLNYASGMMGLADGCALLLGYLLHRVITTSVQSPPGWTLAAGAVVVVLLLVRMVARYPRLSVTGFALLFSVDNVFAGAQILSVSSVAVIGMAVAICSAIFFRLSFQSAEALSGKLKPGVLVGLASALLFISLSL